MDIAAMQSAFDTHFGPGEAPAAVRAPGRVNLIGEHTDYNDGFVLPIAIDKQIVALVRRRDDRTVRLETTADQPGATFELTAELAPGKPQWANYCRGVAAGLLARPDVAGALVGADILFDSTIPLGAGLSSSAALEVATALALLAAAGAGPIDGRELALLCQKAEHEFAGTPCGVMDQSIVILGQANHALLLDCRDGATRQVPFDNPDLVLLVCDTQVSHELSDGGYAARRAQCESAAAKLGVAALRDATMSRVEAHEGLDDIERKRARHVVGEIDRTIRAVAALESGDFARFGELMYGSHAALRDDYEVSCVELDRIVEIAREQPGVYGARMTGGGFGGSAIVLCEADQAESISEAVASGYEQFFGRRCPIFATVAAAGASAL